MQLAIDVQSTFLDPSHSATAGHIPHSALEFHLDEIITSASQLEACLDGALIEHFPENHNTTEQSAYRIGTCYSVPDDSSPNSDTKEDLIATFMDSIMIILCSEVAIVDV
jgi:hypothetical protein